MATIEFKDNKCTWVLHLLCLDPMFWFCASDKRKLLETYLINNKITKFTISIPYWWTCILKSLGRCLLRLTRGLQKYSSAQLSDLSDIKFIKQCCTDISCIILDSKALKIRKRFETYHRIQLPFLISRGLSSSLTMFESQISYVFCSNATDQRQLLNMYI